MQHEPPPLPGGTPPSTPPPLPPPLLQASPRYSPIPPLCPTGPEQKRRFSRPLAIVLVVIVAFAGFMGFRLFQLAVYHREHPRQQSPAEVAFHAADRQIIGGRQGIAVGNSPEAVALARQFSTSLKSVRTELFTKGRESALSLTNGEFITYCQLRSDACVFLVHVPELRRFTGEAKEALAELAWANAQEVLQERAAPPPRTVAVGVKGAFLYNAILIGDYVADDTDPLEAIKSRGSGFGDVPLLYPFFAPVAETASSASTPPAAIASKP